MCSFVRRDGLDAVVYIGTEASLLEVGLSEVGKPLLVEGVLKVLEGESVVQDVSVSGT